MENIKYANAIYTSQQRKILHFNQLVVQLEAQNKDLSFAVMKSNAEVSAYKVANINLGDQMVEQKGKNFQLKRENRALKIIIGAGISYIIIDKVRK